MSNLAIGLALGSSVGGNNGSDSSAKKTYYCNQIMPVFNPKTATVKDKQNYASCVDHFYPTMSPADIIAMKVIIVITFLVSIAGAYLGYKDGGLLLSVLFGVTAPILAFIAMVIFYAGFIFIIS